MSVPMCLPVRNGGTHTYPLLSIHTESHKIFRITWLFNAASHLSTFTKLHHDIFPGMRFIMVNPLLLPPSLRKCPSYTRTQNHRDEIPEAPHRLFTVTTITPQLTPSPPPPKSLGTLPPFNHYFLSPSRTTDTLTDQEGVRVKCGRPCRSLGHIPGKEQEQIVRQEHEQLYEHLL